MVEYSGYLIQEVFIRFPDANDLTLQQMESEYLLVGGLCILTGMVGLLSRISYSLPECSMLAVLFSC